MKTVVLDMSRFDNASKWVINFMDMFGRFADPNAASAQFDIIVPTVGLIALVENVLSTQKALEKDIHRHRLMRGAPVKTLANQN